MPSGLAVPTVAVAGQPDVLVGLRGSVRFGLKIVRIGQNSLPRPRRRRLRLETFFQGNSLFGPIAHIVLTETAPNVPTPRIALGIMTFLW